MENEFHYLGNNVLLDGADRSSYSVLGDDSLLVTPIKKSFDQGKLALGILARLAAIKGAFAATNAFKAKLGVQMLSQIGSDAIEQIIRGEFDPISMGINVEFEIITLGCGELLTKTKIGKNISKKVSDKTTEIVEGIANRINKANEFKNNISENLKDIFTLENMENLSKSLWTPKWYDDMFDKVVDSAENAIVNFRRNIDDFRRQMDIFINRDFALETASASPNYARRNIERSNNNIMHSNSLGDNIQEAAEKTGELDYYDKKVKELYDIEKQ